MKILQLHTDFIEFSLIKKEIDFAEEAERKDYRYDDILSLFVCIEKNDDEEVAEKAIEDCLNFCKEQNIKKILIYPYAHLSSNLANPLRAKKIFEHMERYAKERIEAYKAPFGWNKKLSFSIKGYPLAEQFKSYERKEEKAIKEEEKVFSEWFILKDGVLIKHEDFDFKDYPNLKIFAEYEISKVRAVTEVPPHIPLMQKLEIAGFEKGSDPGNLRFYPKGRLIKSLLEEFVSNKVKEYGGLEVETPLFYDYSHPALSNYLERFPARHYVVVSDKKEFFARFAACFGQFLLIKDSQISYKNLPLKIYELTRYSFRREKSGELAGLKRLRSFTMPDMHTFCKDLDQAKIEFLKQFNFCLEVLEEIGFERKDFETALRFTKEFFEKNKDFIKEIEKIFKKPILVEVWNYRYAYFDPKFEFNFVDAQKKAAALSTVQIDHENGERYGIYYVDSDGKKRNPIILHCSPSGAIERVIYALLEKAYLEEKEGKAPLLPTWLSPTQVRIIPVSEKNLKYSENVLEVLIKKKIRVDLDDRSESVEKRIREAEIEWIPYILVIGKKEEENKNVSVRIRRTKEIKEMKIEEFVRMIKKEVKNKPFKSLNLPVRLSLRPKFS